jgi:hypothetical protein
MVDRPGHIDFKDLDEAEEQEQKKKTSLIDFFKKYPDVVTNLGDDDREISFIKAQNIKKLKEQKDVKGVSFSKYPRTEETTKMAIARSIEIREMLKDKPDMNPVAKKRLEAELMALSRLDIGGRGGTEEMGKLGIRKPETDYKDPDEYLGGMYPGEKIDEEKKLTLKGRLANLWADADKRDAILGGIMDAMTEVKFGEDAYQSRLYDTQKKIRQNLKMAEMTKLARQKAQLDMMKVVAETSKLADPAQYMTTSQKDAMAIVNASGLKPGSPEWNQAYATQLQQIVVKDLTSAKATALTPLYTYAIALLASKDPQDKLTGQVMKRAIESIAGYLAGTDTGGGKSQRAEIVVEEETETKPIKLI